MQGYKIFCTHMTPGGACNVNTVITDNIVTSSTFLPSSPKFKSNQTTVGKFIKKVVNMLYSHLF